VLKRICTEIEDGCPVGRLFDMDVTETDGMQLRRQSERACIVCGRPGRECASRRLHSAGEVMEASEKLMREHFLSLDSGCAADMLVEALNDEVLTTPKPGLVDMNNNGSHDDMDVQLFLRSSNSLREYFRSCFIAGAESITGGKELFYRLRELGIEAEGWMYEATGGINTHKGAIYTLGIISSAAGRLWSPDGRKESPEEICLECGRIAGLSARDHLMKISGSGAETSGEKLYLQLGLPGARGEMADGLPSVRDVSLPAYQRYIREGHSTNDSAAYSLLHLIALGKDTNMYARGGKAQAEAAVKEVREMLKKKDPPDLCEIEGLDRNFIERRLSPGGCADLLAATLFLNRYCI
jgi:holo-ACP synthase/triphosphoribosyl-dephospho-CoA synthase